MNNELKSLREQIDAVDMELVEAFRARQRLASEIAGVKLKNNIAVTDVKREQEVLSRAFEQVPDSDRAAVATFMRTLISLSKIRQNEHSGLIRALEFPAPVPRKTGNIAYQGVSGAWGEQAAQQMFTDAPLIECGYFADVFEAVTDGRAVYGVVPLENSRTGAIGEVYDLLRRNACFITGQLWLTVSQCLVGLPGTKLSDIREVFSHSQGFAQCRRFLKNKNWEQTEVRNTAVAARTAAERANPKFAAIASARAASIYGLEVLAQDIADDKGNKTRFIVIASEPEYDDSGDTVTITFSVRHYSGSLVAVLQNFMLAGIDMKRIESRPAATPDNYRFFVDLEANITNPAVRGALNAAAMDCEYFEVLGCYATRTD